MGPAVAIHTGGSFDVLQDEVPCPASQYGCYYKLSPPPSLADARDALKELPVGYQKAIPCAVSAQDIKPWSATDKSPDKSQHRQPSSTPSDSQPLKVKLHRRQSRHRRPPVESETFEPLDVIQETSFAAQAEAPPPPDRPAERQAPAQDTAWLDDKHLAGQSEWLMTYPLPMASAKCHGLAGEGHCTSPASESVVYACKMLRHGHQWSSAEHDDMSHHPANSYALLATPVRDAAVLQSDMGQLRDSLYSAASQPAWHPEGPLKVPELVTVVEEVLSPSLSAVSERSGSLGADSARTSSFSVPRIEDSLEELDKLEDELEAVNAATLARGLAPVENKPISPAPTTPSDRTQTVLKRASIAGQSLTVRVKPCEKARSKFRRAASLSLRDKKPERPDTAAEHKPTGVPRRDKVASLRMATPKSAVKSQRPLTVPKFELPGDAVAKRLREQREARQARQAVAHSETQPKPRVGRPLAKPTFELPGEAISRRKREEREAKLRAEEAEERKKREFKARPVRHTIGPATLPRETVASRARQNRCSGEDTEATERSRIASREWADKKRLKEAAARVVAKQAKQTAMGA